PLCRAHLLPGELWQGRQVERAPGGAEPELAPALHRLRPCRARHADTLRHFVLGFEEGEGMKRVKSALPWGVVALVVVWVAAGCFPPKDQGGFDVYGFGSLPVQHEGRLKPLDTVARSTLLSLRSKQTVRTEQGSLGATRWFLDMAARPEVAD